MAWFERFASALRADAHHRVDVRGQETTMLKEHVHRAEEALQRKRAAFVGLAAEAARMNAERDRAQADCTRLEGDIDRALGRGRQDLARYAIRLVLRRRRIVESVERRLAQVAKDQKALEMVVARQQALLDELRPRVQACLSDWEADHLDASADPVTDEQVELELLRRTAQARPAIDDDAGPGDA